MKPTLAALAALLVAAAARADDAPRVPAAPADAAVETGPGVDARATVAVLNRYVFRGWRYGGANGVVQPALDVSRGGFTAGLWANVDAHEEATSAFAPRRPGGWSLNEVDLSLGWARTLGRFTMGAGWSYYGTTYADPTHELLLSASVDVPGAPALTVHRDVGALPATYVNLAFSQAFSIGPRTALSLGAAFGWLGGDGAVWRTRSADGTPGPMYRALHDGAVEAALELAAGGATVRPSVQLFFPLSDDAARPGFDPAGPVGTTLVFGVAIAAGTEQR